MGKRIEFDYKEKHYILEYSKRTVKIAEEEGFNFDDLAKKPLAMIEILFRCAFYKNHKSIQFNSDIANEIWDSIDDKTGLQEVLVEMYSEPVQQLISGEGQTKWKIVG